jgi:hypothetical protein
MFYLLFGVIHGWVFERFYPWATRDVTVERSAFLLRVGLYAVFLGLTAFWNVVMDYAKIRAVVEDRRSMLGAFLAGWRFVVAHPLTTTAASTLLNAAAFFVKCCSSTRSPPRGQPGRAGVVLAGFVAGQTYLLGRLAVKLAFYASNRALPAFARARKATRPLTAPGPVARRPGRSSTRRASELIFNPCVHWHRYPLARGCASAFTRRARAAAYPGPEQRGRLGHRCCAGGADRSVPTA